MKHGRRVFVGARAAASATNPDKAVLAMMLAAHEADLSRESWCSPGPQAAYYLIQLGEWGYTLSEVGCLITAHAMKDTKSSKRTETVESAG